MENSAPRNVRMNGLVNKKRMNNPQILTCTNCQSLQQLLCQIDESLYQRIRNKWYSVIYNADTYFNSSVYKDLLRYKRIVQGRIYNPSYPSGGGSSVTNVSSCCSSSLIT